MMYRRQTAVKVEDRGPKRSYEKYRATVHGNTIQRSACLQFTINIRKSSADSVRAGLDYGSGESAQLSVDVPTSSEGHWEDRCIDSNKDPPQDRGTEGMDLSGKTRKRGRDNDPAEKEKEDNGKKLVKEEELKRTGPVALSLKCARTIEVD
ncbi:Hypothetical predicted protein [Mytilus galloprovincialis]|uniref:Uncharacterized protein n=1 Tax=Mytilus galloprovincialis TaxID=29158 RepID=A0A8B6D6H1_MYTGA|nr:Hypothetical predicted protein [Mytilus galloprovincialis]